MSEANLKRLSATQSNLVKYFMGLGKRHRHTNLLTAMNICSIKSVLAGRVLSLYNRMFKCESPLKDLNLFLLSKYLTTGSLIKGTILHRVVSMGESPVKSIFNYCPNKQCAGSINDGTVDSVKYLIHHTNYIKPWSTEYGLCKLLCKAF